MSNIWKDEETATKEKTKGTGNIMCSTHTKKCTSKISKFCVAGIWATLSECQ